MKSWENAVKGIILLSLLLLLAKPAAAQQVDPESFATFGDFLAWLATPVGLGMAVVAIVGLLKKVRSNGPKDWLWTVGEWIRGHAGIVAIAIAVVITVLGLVITESGLIPYIEDYWSSIVLVWVVSQAIYNGQKSITRTARSAFL